MSKMEEKHGREKITRYTETIKEIIADNIVKREESYPFDKIDGEFIADMVISIRQGFQKGSIPLSSQTAINQGFDICVSDLPPKNWAIWKESLFY